MDRVMLGAYITEPRDTQYRSMTGKAVSWRQVLSLPLLVKTTTSLTRISLLGAMVALLPCRARSQQQQNSAGHGSPLEVAALVAKVEGLKRELKELQDKKNRLNEEVFTLAKEVALAEIAKRTVEMEQARLMKMMGKSHRGPGGANPKSFPKDPIRFDAPRG